MERYSQQINDANKQLEPARINYLTWQFVASIFKEFSYAKITKGPYPFDNDMILVIPVSQHIIQTKTRIIEINIEPNTILLAKSMNINLSPGPIIIPLYFSAELNGETKY